MATGIDLIRAERERQVAEEGFTAEHDAQHNLIALLKASECYARRPEERHIVKECWSDEDDTYFTGREYLHSAQNGRLVSEKN